MRRPRKINDQELLQKIDSGIPRKEIADYFHCSQVAISKRLAKLRNSPQILQPLKFDSLTPKEKKFVSAIVSGDTQARAVRKAYDVSSDDSAKSLGHTLMKNRGVQEAIAEIREREIPLSYLMKRLRQHVDCADSAISLRAVDMGFKLHDVYPANKNLNLNADLTIHPVDLSRFSNRKTDKQDVKE